MAVCCFLFGATFYNEVNAQGLGSDRSGWSYFTMPDGRTIVSQGGGVIGSIPATPLYTSPPAGAAVVNNGRALAVSGGSVVATASSDLKVGRASLPITASAKVGGPAIGALLKKALPLVPVLGTGVALYDLAKELGFNPSRSGQELVVTRNDPTVAAGCAGGPPQSQQTYYVGGGCYGNYDGGRYFVINVIRNGNYCVVRGTCSNGSYPNTDLYGYSPTGLDPQATPSSVAELEASIAAKTGWPDASSVVKALDQAQRVTGDTIPTEGPKVSGPPSVTGPKETTTTPITNGTRETIKQTNYNCTYADGATVMDGGIVSCTEQVTTTEKDTVTDPQTQQTTVTTKQTEQVTKAADTTAQKPQEVTDPCDKNPDRVGCGTLDTPEGEIPKVTKTFDYQYEELGLGNGSCPAPTTVSTSNGTYTLDLGQYCDAITTFVRPVVILFGMLAAFFIAIPVKTEGA